VEDEYLEAQLEILSHRHEKRREKILQFLVEGEGEIQEGKGDLLDNVFTRKKRGKKRFPPM